MICFINVDHVTHSGAATTVTTFVIQFLPTAVFLIVIFFLMLIRNSNLICSFSDVVCMVNRNGTETNNLPTDSIRHVLGFHVCYFIYYLAVYFCVLSSAWVYSLGQFWVDIPLNSLSWIFSCILCLTSQNVNTPLEKNIQQQQQESRYCLNIPHYPVVVCLVTSLFFDSD
uniref:Serine incorporator 5 n=1 Tax=Heterorhabditis bacteriophora TaxID=37862 RepID=A0A1I7WPQ2_HETBA